MYWSYRPRAIFRLFLSCSRRSSSSINRSCSSSSCLAILALKESNIHQTWIRYEIEGIQTGKPRMLSIQCIRWVTASLWTMNEVAQKPDPSKRLNGMVEYRTIKCLIILITKLSWSSEQGVQYLEYKAYRYIQYVATKIIILYYKSFYFNLYNIILDKIREAIYLLFSSISIVAKSASMSLSSSSLPAYLLGSYLQRKSKLESKYL